MRPIQKKLVKFCKPEHNIVRGARTIQLGTASYYQKHENLEIQDPVESLGEYIQNYKRADGAWFHDNLYRDVTMQIPEYYMFCSSVYNETTKVNFENYSDRYFINDPSRFAGLIGVLL